MLAPVRLLQTKIGWLKRSAVMYARGMSKARSPEPGSDWSATKTSRRLVSHRLPFADHLLHGPMD